MKCDCEACNGTGHIPCLDCGGTGSFYGHIEKMVLFPAMKNYEELCALKADALRVIRQAERLKSLRPERADCYAEQLKSTLNTINLQAERVAGNTK